MILEELRRVLESEENIKNLKEFREASALNKLSYYQNRSIEYLTVFEFEINHVKYEIYWEDLRSTCVLLSKNFLFHFDDIYIANYGKEWVRELIFEISYNRFTIFLEEKK